MADSDANRRTMLITINKITTITEADKKQSHVVKYCWLQRDRCARDNSKTLNYKFQILYH